MQISQNHQKYFVFLCTEICVTIKKSNNIYKCFIEYVDTYLTYKPVL